MPYPKLIGRGTKVLIDYKIRGIPWLYILDTKGIIRSSNQFLKYDKIKEVLDTLIEPEEN